MFRWVICKKKNKLNNSRFWAGWSLEEENLVLEEEKEKLIIDDFQMGDLQEKRKWFEVDFELADPQKKRL